ncbi:hypothetical protein [Rhodococcus sp. NPDC004095]
MVTASGAHPPVAPQAGVGRDADALLFAVGAAARAVDLVRWSARTTLDTVRVVPGVGGLIDSVTTATIDRGEAAVRTATAAARTVLRTVVREVVAAALLEVDLTRIVRDHVDLDAIAEGIDVDAVAARVDVDAIVRRVDVDDVIRRVDLDAVVDTVDLGRQVDRVDLDAAAARIDIDAIARRIDIDAIIARVDLLGLANEVIDGVDLPQIIRDSTGSLSEEAVRGVRSQGMQADDAVAGFVGRLFGRDRHNHGYPAGDAGSEL